jgi:hypothetical protein
MNFPDVNNLPTDKEFEEAKKRNTVKALMQIWNDMPKRPPLEIKLLSPDELAERLAEEAKGHEGLIKVDGFWEMPGVPEFGKWPNKHIAAHKLELWKESHEH